MTAPNTRWDEINITAFSASGFRNLEKIEIEPCAGVNVIYGDNGHGKTNLLEGISMFSGMRSFRGARNSQMIKDGEKFSRLETSFYAEGRQQDAAMVITDGARNLTLNGVKKEAASAMIGRFCTVVFSPDRMLLITGGASERRRFIDAAISQILPGYTSTLYKFNQILQQRNTLLKEISVNPSLKSTVEVWDASLASYGAAVVCRRHNLICSLSPAAAEIYGQMSSGREQLSLRYDCSLARSLPDGELKGAEYEQAVKQIALLYQEQLSQTLSGDMKLGYTFHGPQRDDLSVLINDRDARTYGSQGQKRSSVLSLKLAEASLLGDILDERPVALLDDVMSELDYSRQDFLLNRLRDWQVFITCCDPAPLRLMDSGCIFRVENGCVERERSC